MTPSDALALAIDVADEGLAAGEMPIGAVVLLGEEVVGRAHTEERTQRRRIVHADLLAMQRADEALGFARRDRPLTLVVTLEPCLMCLGAAIALQVDRVWFGLWSPDDGGVDLLAQWRPRRELPFFKPPTEIVGGFGEDVIRARFQAYADDPAHPAGMREWCRGLAGDQQRGRDSNPR